MHMHRRLELTILQEKNKEKKTLHCNNAQFLENYIMNQAFSSMWAVWFELGTFLHNPTQCWDICKSLPVWRKHGDFTVSIRRHSARTIRSRSHKWGESRAPKRYDQTEKCSRTVPFCALRSFRVSIQEWGECSELCGYQYNETAPLFL